MSAETPFSISVADAQIELLKKKLALTVFPDELEDSGRQYGAQLNDIRRLVAYWQDGFDWRAQEARLNELLPQFTRPISVDGHGTLNIHYVHSRSERANAIPLLFIHGWPGSFIEVTKILRPLVAPESTDVPAFHVVAFSLPGFGFSEAPKTKGFAVPQYAEAAHKLMLALGYDEYVTQGGDWGHIITRVMALKYGPKHIKAWHSNVAAFPQPNLKIAPWQYVRYMLTPYTRVERDGLARTHYFRTEGIGYSKEQATQPQTIGYSLTDSPVGLLAWIYEKLINWTDDYPWTDDEILTWVSIYFFSFPGPTASLRIYYEATHNLVGRVVPTVPLGVSYFPKEIYTVPEVWVRANSNLVFTSYHKRGGHFAAYECPEELVKDLHRFYGRGGPAGGVVTGRSG